MKIILKKIAAVSIILGSLSFSGQGAEGQPSPSNFEELWLGHVIPPLNIHDLTFNNPELLPSVMLTSKTWNEKTRDLWEATTYSYGVMQKNWAEAFTRNKNYNEEYFLGHFKAQNEGARALVFQSYFQHHVFGMGGEKTGWTISHITSCGYCRGIGNDALSSVKKGLKDFLENAKKCCIPTESYPLQDVYLKFNYLHIFQILYKSEANLKSLVELNKLLNHFKTLKTKHQVKNLEFNTINNILYDINHAYEDYPIADKENFILINMNKIIDNMIVCIKYLLVDNNWSSQYFRV